jgi:sugar phosphate isomerase/epimerase
MIRDRIIPSTMIFGLLSLNDALQNIRNAGYDKAELCIAPGLSNHYDIRNANQSTLAEALRAVAQSGVRVVAVNFGLHWLDQEGHVADGMDLIAQNALHLTSALGARVMTFAAGPITPSDKRSHWLKKIAGRNAEMADRAGERGIVFSIEAPHKLSIAEQQDDIDSFWADQIDAVKTTLDCAHMTYAGLDPAHVAQRLAYRCAHAHLRDAVKGNSLLKYGEGSVDFKQYINAVASAGYKGYFSMEFPTKSAEEGVQRLEHAKQFFAALFPET